MLEKKERERERRESSPQGWIDKKGRKRCVLAVSMDQCNGRTRSRNEKKKKKNWSDGISRCNRVIAVVARRVAPEGRLLGWSSLSLNPSNFVNFVVHLLRFSLKSFLLFSPRLVSFLCLLHLFYLYVVFDFFRDTAKTKILTVEQKKKTIHIRK